MITILGGIAIFAIAAGVGHIGYTLRVWSFVKRFRKEYGTDPDIDDIIKYL